MDIKEARGIAAQSWCDEETKDRIMDPALAEAFAKRLMQVSNEQTAFQLARMTMAKSLKDPSLRIGYVANVAMLLYDKYGITDMEPWNKAGEEIIHLIFES